MLEILNQFQNEIIATLSILLLLILYVIIKKKQKKSTVVEDPYDIDESVADITTQKPQQTIQEIVPKEQTPPQSSKKSVSQALKKEVPPHGKIHKEDFKTFANKRILLAEDNIINQKVILGLLAESNMEIVVANDGQEVLDILQNDTNFMLVLMDAHMPKVDGFEATRKIRANPAYNHIAVIALSGDTASDDIKKMYDAGMEGHLEKPLQIDLLYDTLSTYRDNPVPSQSKEFSDSDKSHEDMAVLNPQEGLDVCGNDENFYRDILREFVQNYNDSSLKLQHCINNKQFAEADKLLLDVVGISANIGAKKLHDTAQNFKSALKNNPSAIKELFLEYHQNLKDVFDAIKEYVKK